MRLLISGFCLLLLSISVNADTCTPPMVRVTGEGRVSVKPDRVMIEIGVTSEAKTAGAAAADNARKLSEVLSRLRVLLGPNAEISTVGYSLQPQHRYRGEEGPILIGYTAMNTLRIRTDDLEVVGPLIDTATAAGANALNTLQFHLKDEGPVRMRALAEAARQAHVKAEAIADALGMRVVAVRQIEESSGFVRPVMMRRMEMMGDAAASTPIESGTTDIVATVIAEFEIR